MIFNRTVVSYLYIGITTNSKPLFHSLKVTPFIPINLYKIKRPDLEYLEGNLESVFVPCILLFEVMHSHAFAVFHAYTLQARRST